MELSRIRQLLGSTDKPAGRKEQPVQKENKILENLLIAPDKLFKSLSNLSFSAKPVLSLGFADMNNSTDGLINENTRVLHIGDSHTVGHYGHEMDKLMRQTGAKVQTYGSSGSSPSSWLNGYVTKSGFFGKDDKGVDSSPANWKTPYKTPNLNNLINDFKPNVIVFSLGANLLGYAKNITALEEKLSKETDPLKKEKISRDIQNNESALEKETRKVCDIAKAAGAKIVWVGPPDGRADKKPLKVQDNLYETIQKVASEYGTFVDSRPYTDYPAKMGGDGVHYWGRDGEKISKDWAGQVFNDIQKAK